MPGSKITGSIDLVDRIASSGTQDAFQNIFLGPSLKIAPSANAEETNGLVQSKVKNDPNAIGFVSFAFTGGVNTVGYQGIPCTLRNAKSGQYQGVRNFWMVTKGSPKGAASKFIAWVTSGNTDDQKDHRLAVDNDPLGADETRSRRAGGQPSRRALREDS